MSSFFIDLKCKIFDENFTKSTRFCNWSNLFHVIVFFFRNLLWRRQKYVMLSVSIQRPWSVSLKNIFVDIVDLAFVGQFTFSQNFENNWNKNVIFHQIFKIILINENSFLQIYRNEMNFLTYWSLRIKWLFPKSLKITKETAIHKKIFSQRF